jgi:hypothetical protein
MNYAWAIALIIIVGIAIFALDVGGLRTSIEGKSSTATQLGETLGITDSIYLAGSPGEVRVSLQNNGGARLNLTNVSVTEVNGNSVTGFNDTAVVMFPGDSVARTSIDVSGGVNTGNPVDFTVQIEYTDLDSEIDHTRRRELTATAQ